ncbi:MAG: acyltransferase family protein [Oscillospiraceae bacterium]|nr:acyltransferase family protein [Oscillospiraceae bacterium]
MEEQNKTVDAAKLQNRKLDIDLVKAIAVFCIVCIHASTGAFSSPTASFDWTSALLWGCLTRAGVPLFLMCTGALMLNPRKELPLKKLYGKNLPRLVASLFFWAAVYGLYQLLCQRNLNAASLIQLGKDLLLFRHEQHLYYLHMIFLVYAMLPVTRIFIQAATRRQLEYALVLWFLTGILHPSLMHWPPFKQLSGIPRQWGLNMTWACIGYGMLGWYLQRYWSGRKCLFAWLAVLGFGLTFAGTYFLSVGGGALNDTLLGGMSVNVCLLAVGIFGLCVDAKPGKWAQKLSQSSFCIYLSHMLFLRVLRPLLFHAQFMRCLWSIPLLTFSTMICSFLLYEVLRRIPFVKNWLI